MKSLYSRNRISAEVKTHERELLLCEGKESFMELLLFKLGLPERIRIYLLKEGS